MSGEIVLVNVWYKVVGKPLVKTYLLVDSPINHHGVKKDLIAAGVEGHIGIIHVSAEQQ